MKNERYLIEKIEILNLPSEEQEMHLEQQNQ